MIQYDSSQYGTYLDGWREMRPHDFYTAARTSYNQSSQSYNLGKWSRHLDSVVPHNVGFMLNYTRDNRTYSPLSVYLPNKITFLPVGNGAGELRYGPNGEDFSSRSPRDLFPMPLNGWIMGEWNPMTQMWRLGINDKPEWGSITWTGLRARPDDAVTFTDHITSNARSNILLFGPAEDVFEQAKYNHWNASKQDDLLNPARPGSFLLGRNTQEVDEARSDAFGTGRHPHRGHYPTQMDTSCDLVDQRTNFPGHSGYPSSRYIQLP